MPIVGFRFRAYTDERWGR